MEFRVDNQDHATSIGIIGSIDALTADEVEQVLQKQIGEGKLHIVIDMAEVDYVSSVGLRVFLTALKDIRRRDGDLRLACAQPSVSRMLNMSGFTSIIKFFDTVDEAMNSFATGGWS